MDPNNVLSTQELASYALLATPVVEAHQLERHFGAVRAVDGIDLTVREGEVFGFLGPNGAGKSTLFRMLMGLVRPSQGSIRILGLELPRDADRVRNQVGYMAQRFSLYEDLTVRENLEFAAEIFGLASTGRRQRVDERLATLGLDERQHRRVGTQSGGWKQRVALAVATIHDPPLLLLDEPTAGVDPENRRRFWSEIFDLAGAGTTILVSTHYMDEAVRCHRLALMLSGRCVAEGAPSMLERELRGRVLEIDAPLVTEVIDYLHDDPEIASIAQLGHRAHVLLKPGASSAQDAATRLEQLLNAANFRNRARPCEPSLEDVFVAVTSGESLGRSGS